MQKHAQLIRSERMSILRKIEHWMELPLFVLGIVWLVLLVLELVGASTATLEFAGTLIWLVFVVDLLLRLAVAPQKWRFLRANVLTVIALAVPALRVFRIARVVRVLRAARAARSLSLVRLITSFNRGMRALSATLGRRGFAYVSLLTALVTALGAAGMYAFERDVASGSMDSYGAALWWTAMLMTTMGSEYWPKTGEGRLLCFLLSLYAFGVFGYVTATIATFFIGRDAEASEGEIAGSRQIARLSEQIEALRADLLALRASAGVNTQAQGERRRSEQQES
jgi:voltage-gated potassium channel